MYFTNRIIVSKFEHCMLSLLHRANQNELNYIALLKTIVN